MVKSEYDKARRERFKRSGTCVQCRAPSIGQVRCGSCAKKQRSKFKLWYKKNIESEQKRCLKYHHDNREESINRMKVFRSKNPEYFKEIKFGGNRERVIIRDRYACKKCGMSRTEHRRIFEIDLHVDHIDGRGYVIKKKLNKNPNHDMANLQTLCISCHMKKTVRVDIPRHGNKKNKII